MEELILKCAATSEHDIEVSGSFDHDGELNVLMNSSSDDIYLSKEDVEKLYNHLGKILNK